MRFYSIFLILIPFKVFSGVPIWGNELHDFHIHPRNPKLLVFAPNVYGVFEYDLSNKRYTFYQSPEKPSLQPYVKTRILIDKEPNLYWVSFDHNLYHVHRMTKKWEKVDLQLKKKEWIGLLKQDLKNPDMLWILTNQRILQWNKKEHQLLSFSEKNKTEDEFWFGSDEDKKYTEIKYFSQIKNIHNILKIKDNLYAISKNAGLYVYDLKKEEGTKLDFLEPLTFFKIYKTYKGELWLAAAGEILKINPATQNILFKLTPQEWKSPLLKSKDLKVQEYTINSYFDEKDHDFVFKTISPFLISKEESIRLAAAQTFSRQWPQALLPQFLKLMEKTVKAEKNEKVLIGFLDILAFNPSQKTLELSKDFLTHQSPLVVEKAKWAVEYITEKMGKINDKQP
ncbi:MAG: hypothetical protein HYW47_07685 [Deltaproteobacteria bacterium]|nr:hypothetical protein [Deltaproteobacteria bacterium]